MMDRYSQEAKRIRDVYAKRDASGKRHLYGWNQADELLSQYLLRAAVAEALTKAGIDNFAELDCLDVGCGAGAWLRSLMEWGAEPSRLHGVDLLADRIEQARAISPHIDFSVSPGWPLPFGDFSMDIVSAYTVFSSILDPNARAALAGEMMRIVRPSGLILIYDFRARSLRNCDTVGVGLNEIKRLFHGMQANYKMVSMVPPLQRQLVKWSPALAHFMEMLLPFMRTHALCVLKRTES